jgi:pilus assembly protein CpaB
MRARLHQGLLAIRTHWSAWRTAVLLLGMLGFGLLAVLGAYSYIQERVAVERARLGVGQERIEVLVAARALQRGEAVSTDNLAVRALPREILPGGALSPSRMDAIQGLRLQWPMQPGEPLLASAVFAAESAGLSSRLKHGVRALTIAVDETNAISGLLQPGDRIDLLLSWRPTPLAGVALPELTRTVMQDVVVIATGRHARATPVEEAPGRTFSAITVEVDPEQAQKLVVAQRSGRLTAVLRNPADREAHEDRVLDVHELMGVARPSAGGLGLMQSLTFAQNRNRAGMRDGAAGSVNDAPGVVLAPAVPTVRGPQASRGSGEPGVEVIVGGRGPIGTSTATPAGGSAIAQPAGYPRSSDAAQATSSGQGAFAGQRTSNEVPAAGSATAWPDLAPPTTVPLLR